MEEQLKEYCNIVRSSSNENDKAIKMLFENKLYKKVIGTLREELDLYVRTLYLLYQNKDDRKRLVNDFFENIRWKDLDGKIITDKKMINLANKIGNSWESISYKFACCFIHLSILHNYSNQDVIKIIDNNEKKIIIDYINQYHKANLEMNCTFEDIMKYSLSIFEKIKDNMEYYLDALEKDENISI